VSQFEMTMTCNECGKSSSFDLDSADATDARCPLCGVFQMKAEQVRAFGEHLATWLEGPPISENELARTRQMVERFFWLAMRRNIVDVPTPEILLASEVELRLYAPVIRRMSEAVTAASA
jgi:hypothetical protein